MVVFTILLVGVLITGVASNPTGPPMAACGTLTPGHNPSTGNIDPVPYEVTVSSAMYGPGEEITVTVSKIIGANDFRGIMVQARRKSGGTEPVGTFTNPSAGTKTMMCTTADSTWVHADKGDKSTVTATWRAPSSNEGDLVFQATVVQRNDGTSTFYENIMSEDVTHNGMTEEPGMMTTEDDDGNGAGMVQASLLLMVVTVGLLVLTF